MEVISDDRDLLEQVSTRESVRKLREVIDRELTSQERTVVICRYGLDGNKPLRQHEVAVKCGISRSYASRIEKRALQKLRVELEDVE
jgi:RNA polymerase sporulation-specific sigma factor